MKSIIGNAIQISVFGESHGEQMGVTIQGLAPGIPLDLKYMEHQLELRKPKGRISTQRKESDTPIIISGYFNDQTTGTPLCILFKNEQTRSQDYAKTKDIMRPSHADYTAQCKYLGKQDYRGGGHFSGRLTTPIVAAGAICKQILQQKGIVIASHIHTLHHIMDEAFQEGNMEEQMKQLNQSYFPTLSKEKGEEMIAYIEECASKKDSCGGIIESMIINLPEGIGEPLFDSIESVLSHLIFSIPAIKGVSFGLGFAFASYCGSEINDSFYYQNEKVKTKTNHNGGINGGISNGMPITIKSVVKPTPSIYQKQETINIATNENVDLEIAGRHDPAIIHRARVVIDSVIAIGLLDLIVQRYGYSWMVK